MKKILFVRDNIGVGGASSSLVAVYNYLKNKADIEFFIASYEGEDVEFKDKILKKNYILDAYLGHFFSRGIFSKCVMLIFKLIRRFPNNLRCKFEDYLYKSAIHKIEKNKEYDIVVGFMEGISTKLASYFSCNNKIAWVHCDYDRYLPINKSEETLYSRFKTIVTVSEYTSEVFRKRYPCLNDRVETIYNIIDYETIKQKSKADIQDDRFDTKSFVIISVGRIDKVKRFSIIPSIASFLKKNDILFKWYILGPIRQQDEYDKLVNNISTYKVADSVFYLGEKTNPYPYFTRSNLYVCLSSSEACPMVFNEAKVFNLPIVTTDFPSASEFVRQDEDGMILPLEDIAEGIHKMVVDRTYYTKVKSSKSNIDSVSSEIFEKLNKLFL